MACGARSSRRSVPGQARAGPLGSYLNLEQLMAANQASSSDGLIADGALDLAKSDPPPPAFVEIMNNSSG